MLLQAHVLGVGPELTAPLAVIFGILLREALEVRDRRRRLLGLRRTRAGDRRRKR